jgi:hypothetical protein
MCCACLLCCASFVPCSRFGSADIHIKLPLRTIEDTYYNAKGLVSAVHMCGGPSVDNSIGLNRGRASLNTDTEALILGPRGSALVLPPYVSKLSSVPSVSYVSLRSSLSPIYKDAQNISGVYPAFCFLIRSPCNPYPSECTQAKPGLSCSDFLHLRIVNLIPYRLVTRYVTIIPPLLFCLVPNIPFRSVAEGN